VVATFRNTGKWERPHKERTEVKTRRMRVTLLSLAARSKRMDRLDYLLAKGVSLDSKMQWDLFRIAAESNNTSLAQHIIDSGMVLSYNVNNSTRSTNSSSSTSDNDDVERRNKELMKKLMPLVCRLVDRGHSDFITFMVANGFDLYTPTNCQCYDSVEYPLKESYKPPADPFTIGGGNNASHMYPRYRQSVVPSRPPNYYYTYYSELPPCDVLCGLAMVDEHWDMVRYLAASYGANIYLDSLLWATAATVLPFKSSPEAVTALRTGNIHTSIHS
jgi:hypothetical protein